MAIMVVVGLHLEVPAFESPEQRRTGSLAGHFQSGRHVLLLLIRTVLYYMYE